MDFFFLEDLHEVFSPRSTCYNPRAARRFVFSFISNSSSIFGELKRRSPPNRRTFSPRPEFFQISEDLWKAPPPTGVVFTTSTDSYHFAALSQPWSSCSTHLRRRVLLSYSLRDQRKNLPWNDATPPTFSSPPLTILRVRVNLSCPPISTTQVFLQGFIVTCRPLGATTSVSRRSYEYA